MADKADETVVRYHRRLDRTPEKHIPKLPEAEKKLVSAVRGALENCRNKVDEMKDDMAEKKTIEDERSRRKEAEKRLRQYLVDPYGSPGVNSELRHRLPRASKADPLVDMTEFVESSDHSEAEEEAVTRSASQNRTESSLSPKGAKGGKKTARRVLNFQPPAKSPHPSRDGRGKKYPETDDDDDDNNDNDNNNDSQSDDAENIHQHRSREPGKRHHHHHHHHRGKMKAGPPSHGHSAEFPAYPPPVGCYPHYAPMAAAGYPPGHYPGPAYGAPFTITPWSSMSSLGVVPTTFSPRQGQGQGQGQGQTAAGARPGLPLSRSYPLLSGEDVGAVMGGADLAGPAMEALNQDATVPHQSSSAAAADTTTTTADQTSAIPPEQNTAAARNPNSAIPPPELFSQSASSMGSSHYAALPASLPGERAAQFGGVGVGEGHYYPPHSLPPPHPLGVPPGFSLGLPSPFGAEGRSPAVDLSLSAAQSSSLLLQQEVTRLQEANRQLTGRLAMCSREVDTLKLQVLAETSKDGTLDSEAARKFTDLMSEVRAAEKRRQVTMETRVNQAELEKEHLIRDFEHTLLKATNDKGSSRRRLTMRDLSSASETETDESDDSEDEEDEKEEEVKVVKKGHYIPSSSAAAAATRGENHNPDAGRVASLKDALKLLERQQHRELEIYKDELQVVMEQRDQALEQVQEERESNQLQQLHLPTQREGILMAKITALQREKERADITARQLKEEEMERNLYISLHKALFTGTDLNDFKERQPHPADSNKLKTKKGAGDKGDDDVSVDDDDDKNDDDDGGGMTMKEDNQLLEQLRLAHQERSLLQMRCQELEALCKQEKEDKNRLERLNGVLRRKLMAVSSSGSQDSLKE